MTVTPFRVFLLLISCNLFVFGQVVWFEFVNFDDHFYIDNVHVKRGLTWDGIIWAFSKQNFAQFLNWISHMFDVEMFGLNPMGHHIVSLGIHIFNTFLFYLFLNRLTGCQVKSVLAAILFAIHPLRAETVAWISDRKDLLAMLFSLLSLEAYRKYIQSSNFQSFLWVTFWFLLALLSKPVMVILPAVFLLIDYWPLKRFLNKDQFKSSSNFAFYGLLKEKIFWFLISAIFCWVGYENMAFRDYIVVNSQNPVLVRLAMAPVLYLKYLCNIFWPFKLSMYYPMKTEMPEVLSWMGSFLFLGGISWWFWKKRFLEPYLITGWFWFLGALFPLVGIVKAGKHDLADRYTYFPLIGLIILVVWGLTNWFDRKGIGKSLKAGFAVSALMSIMVISWNQTSVWKNSFTLFQRNIEINDGNYIAHNNLALLFMDEKKFPQAVHHLERAIDYCDCIESWLNLGEVYQRMKQNDLAISAYKDLLNTDPKNGIAHFELGKLYQNIGENQLAIFHSMEAEQIFLKVLGSEFWRVVEAQKRITQLNMSQKNLSNNDELIN